MSVAVDHALEQAAAAADGEHALAGNIAERLLKQAEFALEHVFVFHKPGVVLRRVAVKFGFHRQVILSVLSIFKVPPAVSASLLSCAAGCGKTGRACAFLMNHNTISSLPQRYVCGKYPSPFARVHGSFCLSPRSSQAVQKSAEKVGGFPNYSSFAHRIPSYKSRWKGVRLLSISFFRYGSYSHKSTDRMGFELQ